MFSIHPSMFCPVLRSCGGVTESASSKANRGPSRAISLYLGFTTCTRFFRRTGCRSCAFWQQFLSAAKRKPSAWRSRSHQNGIPVCTSRLNRMIDIEFAGQCLASTSRVSDYRSFTCAFPRRPVQYLMSLPFFHLMPEHVSSATCKGMEHSTRRPEHRLGCR